MRTHLSPSRQRPIRTIAAIAGYTALITLVVALFTTSGFVAAVAATLTIGLLVGSYLLEGWARRRTVYAAPSRPPSAVPTATDESRMAKV